MIRTRTRETQVLDSDFLSEEEGAQRFIFRDGYGTNNTNLILDGYIFLSSNVSATPTGSDIVLQNNSGTPEFLTATSTINISPGWSTSSQTSNYTASDHDQIMADTTSSTFTVTLPASPNAGARVRIFDAGLNYETNNLIVDRNGSLINGQASNLTLIHDGDDREFIYTGATRGWAWISAINIY